MLFSSVCSGPVIAPSSSTLSTAIRPNSQMSRLTILPSERPMDSPLDVVCRRKKLTLSTSLAKAQVANFASAQVMMRIRATRPTFSRMSIAWFSSNR